ncbi:MAG TPA: hypothetical protein VFY65_10945 [Longimicrobium sp.]|nr:hypothetical protein [Longimicrobium sp.]
MRKLKLRLEDLEIAGFSTTPGARPRGTVVGEQGTHYTYCTCYQHTCFGTCHQETCADTCAQTCWETCDDYSCAQTCGYSYCRTYCGPEQTCRYNEP